MSLFPFPPPKEDKKKERKNVRMKVTIIEAFQDEAHLKVGILPRVRRLHAHCCSAMSVLPCREEFFFFFFLTIFPPGTVAVFKPRILRVM